VSQSRGERRDQLAEPERSRSRQGSQAASRDRGAAAGPELVLRLQRLAGNDAVAGWLRPLSLQRDGAPAPSKTGPTPTPTAAPDPAADAKALVADADALKTNAGTAKWLLTAHDQGFVTFTEGMKTQDNLENLRDGKKVGNVDPSEATIFGGLSTMHSLALARINRWIADPSKAKETIQFGSFIRTGANAGPHGRAAAIDINQGDFTGSADDVVAVLKDLPVGSYGIGLPFQGDFFPADKNITAMEAAEKAKPAPGAISGALVKFAAHLYKASYDSDKKAYGDPEVETAGAAYTLLKSAALKTEMQAMRTAGSSLVIFPDNDNHLHVDQR
jgi:hypothetical protein